MLRSISRLLISDGLVRSAGEAAEPVELQGCAAKDFGPLAFGRVRGLPFIMAGVQQGIGRGLVGVVIAEIFGGSSGLG